ncbi:MAG: hypothetical protein UV73_C0015G0017 [Candidatus Gottesmanbacteria bacterium GW2011_GWA2_43_14]|uniref:Uncharacterized protein n=1 Tax=Candidatus Gottesmanbacteria bacterium GW2011_GWA2_43_14 TaxID=1618443 RepID=A0A0G1DDH9_9BACT|nr:MAG: hypothetical protein UV73_C0015G0017 [Candidatus Gottesmanbacteria bacterium GW2011_GWA2_43_14]
MLTLIAQGLKLPGATTAIQGPLKGTKFTNLSSLISNAIPLIFPIAGLILFAYLIWGGFDFLTSLGDPKKAEAAKNKITYAVLGFFLIFAAYWIVQLVAYFFKLKPI